MVLTEATRLVVPRAPIAIKSWKKRSVMHVNLSAAQKCFLLNLIKITLDYFISKHRVSNRC